jgi:hypothetical protein
MKWLGPETAGMEQTKRKKHLQCKIQKNNGILEYSGMNMKPFKGSKGKYDHLLTDL